MSEIPGFESAYKKPSSQKSMIERTTAKVFKYQLPVTIEVAGWIIETSGTAPEIPLTLQGLYHE